MRTGIIIAVLQRIGNTPCRYDAVKSACKDGEKVRLAFACDFFDCHAIAPVATTSGMSAEHIAVS